MWIIVIDFYAIQEFAEDGWLPRLVNRFLAFKLYEIVAVFSLVFSIWETDYFIDFSEIKFFGWLLIFLVAAQTLVLSRDVGRGIKICLNKKTNFYVILHLMVELIHEYFGVNLQIVWGVSKVDLAASKPLLEELFKRVNSGGPLWFDA